MWIKGRVTVDIYSLTPLALRWSQFVETRGRGVPTLVGKTFTRSIWVKSRLTPTPFRSYPPSSFYTIIIVSVFPL